MINELNGMLPKHEKNTSFHIRENKYDNYLSNGEAVSNSYMLRLIYTKHLNSIYLSFKAIF